MLEALSRKSTGQCHLVLFADLELRRCCYIRRRHKGDAGLRQHPRFNFVMPHAQQINRAASIVLLGNRRRLVALNLGHDSHRTFDPCRQCPERSPKTMQCKVGMLRHTKGPSCARCGARRACRPPMSCWRTPIRTMPLPRFLDFLPHRHAAGDSRNGARSNTACGSRCTHPKPRRT